MGRFLAGVGGNIRERRKKLGPQSVVGRRLGLDAPALSRAEHGGNLTLRSLFFIAQGLGCSPADLVSVRSMHEES